MIRPEAIDVVEKVGDQETVTLVFQLEAMPDQQLLGQISNMDDRRSAVRSFLRSKKDHLINWVQQRADVEVNDLESVPAVVMTARKSDWKTIMEDPESPLHDQDVSVLPNFRIYPDR